MQRNDSVTLIEAVAVYVSSLKSKDGHAAAGQELQRFVRWFGADRAISELGPSDIDEYGGQAMGAGAGQQALERLQGVRKFLTFARKKGMTELNLAQHLRIRKDKSRSRSVKAGDIRAPTGLSQEGHTRLVSELEELKAKRGPIAIEIRRAAADKDVRENVPLEAAREQLGHLESRIRQVEETLRGAIIVSRPARNAKVVELGSNVRVKDLGSGRETVYRLVSVAEANPLEGKISDVSPVGKALIKRTVGQDVDVETPKGKLRYRIVRVTS